jgi:peptide/nickel transport system substrate-binding protein/microcin C transport system substrate-binding protein
MIEKFEYNLAYPAAGPIYHESAYHNKDIEPVKFNPELALKMLRNEGWSDTDGDNILDKVIDGEKRKFSITILEPWDGFVKYLTIFKEDAKKAGVEINIKIIEWNSFINLLNERKFDAVRLAWGGTIQWDPTQIWHSKSIANAGSNFVGFSNKAVDRLTDEAQLIHDQAKRIEILRKVEKMIVDDYPYAWFFYRKFSMYGNSDRIKKPKDTFNYTIGSSFWEFKSKMKKEE